MPARRHAALLVENEPVPASPLQLQELIRKTAQRDEAAFGSLYAHTAPQLFGVALRISGSREVAEEILQESFVAVWERAADYEPLRGPVLSWMTTIVRHGAIDQLRRRSSRPEGWRAPDETLRILASSDRADSSAERRALQRCLGELEEMPRLTVLLAYVYGMTREELAARFTVPVGTVKSWIRRSLERLKRCLDP